MKNIARFHGNVSVQARLSICVCVYIYIYIYTHTHTRIHTYIHVGASTKEMPKQLQNTMYKLHVYLLTYAMEQSPS